MADSLHNAVRVFDAAGVCGWIVDLRGNGWGNMWPMLAGIGPLLGDSIVGYFGATPEAQAWYYRRGTSGILSAGGAVETASRITVEPVELRSAAPPVAVLYLGVVWDDPDLPAQLLPADWPGDRARRLAARLYKRLLPGATRYAEAIIAGVPSSIPSHKAQR